VARKVERLDKGLNTIQDPGVLEEGYLSEPTRNCIYVPGKGSLQRAPGRAAFGTVSATAIDITGLRDIQFDNGDHYLIAEASSNYFKADITADPLTQTFSSFVTAAVSGTTLEAIQYRNRFYLLNGGVATASAAASNTVVYLSATAQGSAPQSRVHGLLPVTVAPGVSLGVGTFSQTVTGYYEYWTTEVAKLTADGAPFVMESAFVGTPATVFVSATGVVPTISMPATRNALATHWRVYRSPKKDKESDKEFPIGFMISEMGIASASANSIADTLVVTATNYIFPANFNGIADSAVVYLDAGAGATAMASADGVGAPLTPPSIVLGANQGAYGYNFGGFVGNVKGIEVAFKAWISAGTGPAPINITIGPERQTAGGFPSVIQNILGQSGPANRIGAKSAIVTATSNAVSETTLGSPTDRWLPTNVPGLADADFNANFMVVVGASKPGITMRVDYVKVRVSYSATVDGVVQFPTVVYTFGDIAAQVAKNSGPPSSSTGDIYQDQLVLNDVTNQGLIRYSYPGDPEAFPETYFLDFETRENDQVRCIQTVNSRLVVWLDSSTWRVNYLPSERDASFDRGKAVDPISTNYGAVNNMCVCTFSMDGSPELAAFVSRQGIHATDGFSFLTFTDGLDWRGIIGTTNSTPIALVNDRERRLLLFYFRNDAYTPETYLCLPLNYHSSHLVNGRPKVGGLIHMRNAISSTTAELKSAWVAPRARGDSAVYLGYGGATAAGAGQVWLETGTTIPAADPRYQWTSRRMYLADLGNEWEFGELYGYALGYGGTSPALSYSLLTTKTNDTGETTQSPKPITLSGQALHKVIFKQMVEGARINCVATASGFAMEHLVIDGQGWGVEDSGR
jgi:hypothetical protein